MLHAVGEHIHPIQVVTGTKYKGVAPPAGRGVGEIPAQVVVPQVVNKLIHVFVRREDPGATSEPAELARDVVFGVDHGERIDEAFEMLADLRPSQMAQGRLLAGCAGVIGAGRCS